MPWKATCALDERGRFISALEQADKPFSRLCDEFGISRKTGYKWVKRFEIGGLEGLRDCRTNREYPSVFDESIFETVLDLRFLRPTWGPLKLSAYLKTVFPQDRWPSPGTIKLWLKREGLSRPSRRGRFLKYEPIKRDLREITAPNEVWCADFKGWFRTGDGKLCEPLTVIDGFSRYLLHCKTMKSKRHFDMTGVFEGLFKEYGRPAALRSDNGAPFGSQGFGRLSPFAVWLIKQGVWPERSRPGHPEDNGRQERFHRTLKAETARPPAKKLGMQQIKFNAFKNEYNNLRPHESLGQRSPASFYKPGEFGPAPKYEYPETMTVRRIDSKGYVDIGKRTIYLSQSLAYENVGFVKLDEKRYRVEFLGYPVGILIEDYPLGCYL